MDQVVIVVMIVQPPPSSKPPEPPGRAIWKAVVRVVRWLIGLF